MQMLDRLTDENLSLVTGTLLAEQCDEGLLALRLILAEPFSYGRRIA